MPWPFHHALDVREFDLPIQHEGTSTVVPGLHFVGIHFQRKRKSSLWFGVGEDAAIVPGRSPPRIEDRIPADAAPGGSSR